MKKNIFLSLYFFILVLVCFVIFYPYSTASYIAENDGDDETEEVNVEDSIEFSSTSDMHGMINFNVFEDIEKAKMLLEEKQCGFQIVRSKAVIKTKKSVKPKKSSKTKAKKSKKTSKQVYKKITVEETKLGEFSILLAIENVKTRSIQIVKVHPKLGAHTENVVIEPGKSNGVNTKFTIVYPEEHIVLAIKRPVKSGSTFKEVVYTPYSENLDIPEVRKEGMEYLKNILVSAKQDLVARKVKPLSCDEFIADDVLLALAIIEHIDPLKFQSGKYTPEKLINETLVILGTNKQNAYRYSASKAGARGLFQFIPDTYKRILRLYPQAGLHTDFILGMEDHENAAKASFLLFDADMRALNNGRKEQFMKDPRMLGKFLASAYNCGAGKTKIAMDRYGMNWTSRVPVETQVYLKKYDAVWDWLNRKMPDSRS